MSCTHRVVFEGIVVARCSDPRHTSRNWFSRPFFLRVRFPQRERYLLYRLSYVDNTLTGLTKP